MKIGVVIVTYNRLEKLKKCLDAYEKQSYMPESVLIIDNHSTDGSAEYLDKWAEIPSGFRKIVHHKETNTGGAGGFTEGIREALKDTADWIWLADDDAYPASDCLERLCGYYEGLSVEEQEKTVALCGKVVDNNGLSPLHRRRIQKSFLQLKEIPLQASDYEAEAIQIDVFSFVGVLIRTDIIRKAGLPHADYFIFYDDTEYALRVGKYGKLLCVSDAVILHDSLENTIAKYSWKNYYMFRNKLYTYFHYFSKRYCAVEYAKHLYMVAKYYNTVASWKQLYYGTRDALAGRLGRNEKYLP